MNDPKPMQVLFLLLLVGLGFLGLWMFGLPKDVRLARMQRIMLVEQASTLPPATFLAQVDWLTQHRLEYFQGMSLLLLLTLVIGIGQGLTHRASDRLRGVRVRAWTLGLVGSGVTVALGLVGLIYPAPLPLLHTAGIGAALVGLAGYGLAVGYPSIA